MTYSVATFNCALCNLIAHIPDEKGASDNQPPDVLRQEGGGGHGRLGTRLEFQQVSHGFGYSLLQRELFISMSKYL